MVAMAPVLRSCGQHKNSCTKRRPRRSPRHVRARRRYLKRRRRARTVEATKGARTTSRRYAPRGAYVAAKTVVTMSRTVRRTARASIWTTMMTTMTARVICAWQAHSHTRGSTRRCHDFYRLRHLVASIIHKPTYYHAHASHDGLSSTQLTLSSFCASPVLSISVTLSHPVRFFLLFVSFLMHYIAPVHVVTHTQYSQYLGRPHSPYTIQLNLFFGPLCACVLHRFRGIVPIAHLENKGFFILTRHDHTGKSLN